MVIKQYPFDQFQFSRMFLYKSLCCTDRNPGGLFHREMVDARGNRWKRNPARAVLYGNLQAGLITGRQKFPFFFMSALPDRPRRMDHIAAGKLISSCDLCFPGLTAVKCATLFQKLRPCRPVDCPVHTASAKEAGIGRINNSIYICNLRNISADSAEHRFIHYLKPPF